MAYITPAKVAAATVIDLLADGAQRAREIVDGYQPPMTREAYLEYTATLAGTYYVGVSGFSNMDYDPNEIASGGAGNRGDYQIEIMIGGTQQAVQVLSNDDRFGDDRHSTVPARPAASRRS